MRSKLLALLVVVLLLLSGCGGGGGSSSTGSITGVVYIDSDGLSVISATKTGGGASKAPTPVGGATVTAFNGSTSRSATTNDSGQFTITNLAEGSYTVMVHYGNYADLTLSSPVTVTASQTTDVSNQTFVSYTKDWNFLVYLDGDNNLEGAAISDIEEMEKVGSTDRINILVLVDRVEGYDTSNGDWTSTRLYYITKDSQTDGVIRSQLIADYGEKDMSDPNTLRDFITYCQTHYPASHTVLTLWNHGGGVYPRGVQAKNGRTKKSVLSRGICWDDSATDSWGCLTTDEVAQAFSQARTATGQKLDIIAMDACLMQMLEVAYEWRTYGDYLVGSQANVPGEGFNYDDMLQHLAVSPTTAAGTFVQTMVNDYYSNFSGRGDTTISALSLGTELNTLMTAFSNFAGQLNNQTGYSEVKTAFDSTYNFDSSYSEVRDLYSFASNINNTSTDNTLKGYAVTLMTAIDAAVIGHAETGTFRNKAYGLSILLPENANWAYYSSSDRYVLLQLPQDTYWNEFIGKFVTVY